MTERIDAEQVREIVRIAEEAGLAELEVATPALTVRVRRTAAGVAPAATAPAAATVAGEPGPAVDVALPAAAANHLEPLVAPMVGTFYRAATPDAPPFVSEGDYVTEGQVVCIIEAMKLFNEIQAERAGRVARVLVENASPVEYGQPLFLIDPTARRA
jgi:acetyl-CoA carboxylase biotin carboxyl carrier protein